MSSSTLAAERPVMENRLSSDNAIVVKDLWMTFPGKKRGEQIHVLENVDLEVKRGEETRKDFELTTK